jgi:putative transposase
VTEWKKALQGNASSVFESTSAKRDQSFKQKLKDNRLYNHIGQLQVEVDFLKDSYDQLGVVSAEGKMNINKPCKLLGVPPSIYYHKPKRKLSLENELIMQAIDRIYLEEPTYGSRHMLDELQLLGHRLGRDRVRRLTRIIGIEPIYPKPRLSTPAKGYKKYYYLLRGLEIERSNHVWSTNITYIPLGDGHVHLTAVIDWSSRHVISWELSNSLGFH